MSDLLPASLLLAAGLALIALSAMLTQATAQPLPCELADKACAVRALKDHVVTQREFWNAALARPARERIGAAPAALLEYVRLDNIHGELANQPRQARLTPGFMRDVRRAFDELPPRVRALLNERLAGIYFVDDLGGTGYTDVVYDADGKPAAGFIVLDAAVLAQRTANAWASWKENSPFRPAAGMRLEAGIETRRHDNRKNAIQYILLHELGHVMSIGQALHPPWGLPAAEVPTTDSYPFFKLSWSVARGENRYVTHFDQAFAQRRDVVYYFGAKLAGDQMADVYARLAETNFVTLYGSTNPSDDFAEAFASYVHTVLMRKPYLIVIHRNGRRVAKFGACWNQPRCAEKRNIIEQLIGAR